MSPKSLGKKCLCSKHFNPRFLQGKRLPLDAIPDKYVTERESEEDEIMDKENFTMKKDMVKKTYPSSSEHFLQHVQPSTSKTVSDESHSSESEELLTEIQNFPTQRYQKRKLRTLEDENIFLKEQLKSSKKQINNLKTQVAQAKKKIMKMQVSSMSNLREDISHFSKSLVHMQLRHKKRSSWLPSEKRTALSIYYKGPSTYNYLRRKGVILPAVSTVKSWVRNFICKPGFNKKIFSRLAMKCDTMSNDEKKCVVLFDEMAIKRNFEYNKKLDLIEGFQDLGKFGRKAVPANQALAIMIRGIYSPWKLPISYFVSNEGVSAQDLNNIILETFRLLIQAGFKVIGMTCDLSSRNKQFVERLGVSVEKPYIIFDNQKIYAFFDAPHLIKCIRNNFINHDFILDGKIIRFADILKVYELDKQSTTGKALLKITDVHLNPNAFQKMSVKIAAQLLSHSVYSAIKAALRTGQLCSSTGENTALFIKTVDDLFDALNSVRIYAKKPCNKALCLEHQEVLNALDIGYKLFKNLKKLQPKGTLTRPPSFDGMLQSINAVKSFAADERKEGKTFLLTGRLNQDPLENQFSVFRQKGGYNRNPTVLSFRSAFKLNIVTNLMRPPRAANAGGSPDADTNMLDMENDSSLETTLILFNKDEEESNESNSSGTSSHTNASIDDFHPSITLEYCSVVYFAGYLVKKCVDKFGCEDCINTLQTIKDITNEEELLIFYKSYDLQYTSRLKTPSNLLRKCTQIAMTCFNQNIVKFCTKKVMKNIMKKVNKILTASLPEWFDTREECKNHREYVIKLLLRTQVYKYCKELSNKVKTRAGTKNVKLSILQHN